MIVKNSDNGKPPMVLLHGWGLNSGVWDFVLPQLEQLFDVHRIDLPGFGFNNHKQLDRYDLIGLAELIAPLCPAGSVLAGWSLGGLVASQLALQYPGHFSSLCLIASTPCFVEQKSWKGIKPQVLNSFAKALCDDSEKTVARFLAIQAMGSASAREDVKWLKQAVITGGSPKAEALSGGLAILQQIDLRPQLATLTIPIKGIYGRLDSLVAVESVSKLADSLADFEYQVLHQASHAPFISHRDEFIDALKQMYSL
ncbi:MAG: pimeloyl-[acyl-carrier protein] methyl ester esterase [Alteromonadaceae bacterium]|jgi:pimeloyl-[acyl-carrier protein] methyl ester esterase